MNSLSVTTTATQGYAPVNGLKMYYEIEGTGDPLVCIPPAFGYAGLNSYPALVLSHTVITVDLQGHGRTADIPERPLSIENHEIQGDLQISSIRSLETNSQRVQAPRPRGPVRSPVREQP